MTTPTDSSFLHFGYREHPPARRLPSRSDRRNTERVVAVTAQRSGAVHKCTARAVHLAVATPGRGPRHKRSALARGWDRTGFLRAPSGPIVKWRGHSRAWIVLRLPAPPPVRWLRQPAPSTTPPARSAWPDRGLRGSVARRMRLPRAPARSGHPMTPLFDNQTTRADRRAGVRQQRPAAFRGRRLGLRLRRCRGGCRHCGGAR